MRVKILIEGEFNNRQELSKALNDEWDRVTDDIPKTDDFWKLPKINYEKTRNIQSTQEPQA